MGAEFYVSTDADLRHCRESKETSCPITIEGTRKDRKKQTFTGIVHSLEYVRRNPWGPKLADNDAGQRQLISQAQSEKEVMMAKTGTVKWFNTQKGYGFIAPDDGGKDAFVHITAVEASGLDTLSEGQKVSFDVETGRDGKMSAVNLKAAE